MYAKLRMREALTGKYRDPPRPKRAQLPFTNARDGVTAELSRTSVFCVASMRKPTHRHTHPRQQEVYSAAKAEAGHLE
jgi:hypothetical protein